MKCKLVQLSTMEHRGHHGWSKEMMVNEESYIYTHIHIERDHSMCEIYKYYYDKSEKTWKDLEQRCEAVKFVS